MNIPIYNSIKAYTESGPLPFHMPGHKLGRGIPEPFLEDIVKLDLTEIPGTDNLHYPSGPILEAQKLAAKAFGSDETFFLVNGSTCGIHAMIMTVCNPGDKIIVSRDCHKSVINGMIIAGARPVYVKPEYDASFGITMHLEASCLEAALSCNPDAVGVLITRPNYYGVCSDIKRIAEITHSHGKVLMVDEAHGSHLKFNSRLPVCSMQAGADICVQSAHKTLPSLTQGAYLHVKSKQVDTEKLKYMLSMLETSSPSYILMAFLDIARAIMEDKGSRLLDELLDNICWLEAALGGNTALNLLTCENAGCCIIDRTRIVINVKRLGLTGYEAEKILRNKYGIQVEMSDIGNIVCISTIADQEEHFEMLYRGLEGLSTEFKSEILSTDIYNGNMPIPRQGIELNETCKCKRVSLELASSEGRVSLATLTPYPPGIPLVCPGEIISREVIEYIYNIIKSGGIVNGLSADMKLSAAE